MTEPVPTLSGSLAIEAVYIGTDAQYLRRLQVPAGTTLQAALEQSGLWDIAQAEAQPLGLGIWGKRVPADTCVHEGDRVEIYRPLKADPKQSRRERALRHRQPKAP